MMKLCLQFCFFFLQISEETLIPVVMSPPSNHHKVITCHTWVEGVIEMVNAAGLQIFCQSKGTFWFCFSLLLTNIFFFFWLAYSLIASGFKAGLNPRGCVTFNFMYKYTFLKRNWNLLLSGFFLGGRRAPKVVKVLPVPPNRRTSLFFTRPCLPSTSFFFQFWLLFSSKLHQKALFNALNTNICSKFAGGGISGLSGQFSNSPLLILSLYPTWVLSPPPPSDTLPDGDRTIIFWKQVTPTKNLGKNTGFIYSGIYFISVSTCILERVFSHLEGICWDFR